MKAWQRRIGMFVLGFGFAILAQARQPNVVVILTDDQGWGDLSLNGNLNLQTPNIDSLARDGAQFERFYVCPVCSPTRAEFLTGRYHVRTGVYSTSAGGERMDTDETTIADVFKAAGYATGAFGKWHNGMQFPYHPNGRGFEEFYGFCSGHWGHYFSPPLERNGALVKGDGFVIDDFTNQAMAFIEANQDQPFFCYLPYNTPHSPMQVPDRFWEKYSNGELAMRHHEPEKENVGHTLAALAMCENIDWNVGRLLAHLERLDIADETIVVYFCDNGPNGSRWNGGMKGRKGSTDEGGVRSPLLIRWPNEIGKGLKIESIASVMDLLPTLASLCGVPAETKNPIDGVDLKPVLTGKQRLPDDRLIVSHWNGRISVRSQRFRLDNKGALFDFVADPGQTRNVATEHPSVHQWLSQAVTEWREGVLSELDRTKRPFVLGHPGSQYTQMPARDASYSAGIKRSNRFPNCSFLYDWDSTDEMIEWAVEVPAGGRFRVTMHYTCEPANVGSVVQMSLGESRLKKVIDRSHVSLPYGAEHDRVKRVESYVKDFGAIEMGEIDLHKGSGTLRLEALEVVNGGVVDFRLLMFERVSVN